MPYYAAGGYYSPWAAGDNYAAGSIGSFFKKAVRTVGRALIPSPIRAVTDLFQGAGPGGGVTIQPGQRIPVPAASPGGPTMEIGVSPLGTIGIAGEQPRGYHRNASDYFLKDGTFIPKGSRWVKNRHMQPTNFRALKKGLRRAHGFAHLTKSVMSYEITGRHRTGRPHFRRKRRG